MEKLSDNEFLDEMSDHGLPLEYREEINRRLDKGRRAVEVLKEIDDYLKPNPKNSIGTGSILHQKVQEILY